MRFYYMGRQISPKEIKIEMLEQQHLLVDYNKDPMVGWPAHIRAQIRWGLQDALKNIQDMEKQMSRGYDRLIGIVFLVLLGTLFGLCLLWK